MKCVSINVFLGTDKTGTDKTESIDLYVKDSMTDEDILSAIKEAAIEFCKNDSDFSKKGEVIFSYQDFIAYAKLNLKEYNRYFEERGLFFTNSITTRSISVDRNVNLVSG